MLGLSRHRRPHYREHVDGPFHRPLARVLNGLGPGKDQGHSAPDHQDHIARLERRMTVPNAPERNRPASLFLIQKALADRTVLRISYRGSGAAEALRREVEPLGLTYYADRWHLIAWCRLRKDYRDFRTDRIEAILSSSEQFKPDSPL